MGAGSRPRLTPGGTLSPMIDRGSRRLLAVLALAAAAGGCAAAAEALPAPPVAGDRWLLLQGEQASAVVEGKWSLVIFFRPHRPDCNEGFPDLMALCAAYRARGLTAVAVTPDPAEEAKAFIRRHSVPFPVLADAGKVMKAWGIPEIWGNRVYLLNPGGVVVAQDDLPATRRILEKYLPR
jgi:hypothetical protein